MSTKSVPKKRAATLPSAAKKSAPLPTAPAEPPKSRHLTLVVNPGTSMDRAMTDMAGAGVAANAGLVVKFSQAEHGELSLTEMVETLRVSGQAVNRNDLSGVEQMLNAQAVALNAVFAELARRSAVNMGEYIDAMERYMRLALKAQSQCRATLETLAAIKNPPVVFAKQANIASGPQQVNNGVMSGQKAVAPEFSGASSPAHAHGQNTNPSNELLELQDGTRLDAGAQGQASGANPGLATVDAIDRAKVARGEGEGRAEQSEARRAVG